jgi:hypothetical protein
VIFTPEKNNLLFFKPVSSLKITLIFLSFFLRPVSSQLLQKQVSAPLKKQPPFPGSTVRVLKKIL